MKEWDFGPLNVVDGVWGVPYEPDTCAKCHRLASTQAYVGEGGVVGMIHGMSQPWCERCIVAGQLAYAKDRAAAIPTLEARLAELP